MKFYLAPLEGITGHIYRNALEKYFPGTDRYFTPFIVPDQNKILRTKERRDVLPENNHVSQLIPQILTNNADHFVETARMLAELGYQEVNLNLGCPSGTVVSRGRGSGFLAYPEELDRFLEKIFSGTDLRISIKTRLGRDEPEEMFHLMEIYNKYPLAELIIHPRTRQEYYRGTPNLEIFREVLPLSRAKVCYNGNLLTAEDYHRFCQEFSQVDAVMLGRGVIADPGLIRNLVQEEAERLHESGKTQCGKRQATQREAEGAHREEQGYVRWTEKQELRAFHDEVLENYRQLFGEDRNAMFRMKEMWIYLIHLFRDGQTMGKKLRKSSGLGEYLANVERLFAEYELRREGAVEWNLPKR